MSLKCCSYVKSYKERINTHHRYKTELGNKYNQSIKSTGKGLASFFLKLLGMHALIFNFGEISILPLPVRCEVFSPFNIIKF